MKKIRLLFIKEENGLENAISFICKRRKAIIKIGDKNKIHELLGEKWFRKKLFNSMCMGCSLCCQNIEIEWISKV